MQCITPGCTNPAQLTPQGADAGRVGRPEHRYPNLRCRTTRGLYGDAAHGRQRGLLSCCSCCSSRSSPYTRSAVTTMSDHRIPYVGDGPGRVPTVRPNRPD
jgi:hypothetical protein